MNCSHCGKELSELEIMIIESVSEEGFDEHEIDYVCSDCILYPKTSMQ